MNTESAERPHWNPRKTLSERSKEKWGRKKETITETDKTTDRLWNSSRNTTLDPKQLSRLLTNLENQKNPDRGKINAIKNAIENHKRRTLAKIVLKKM